MTLGLFVSNEEDDNEEDTQKPCGSESKRNQWKDEPVPDEDADCDDDVHFPEIQAEARELAALVLPELGDKPDVEEIAFCAALGASFAWRGLADSDQRPPIDDPGEIP